MEKRCNTVQSNTPTSTQSRRQSNQTSRPTSPNTRQTGRNRSQTRQVVPNIRSTSPVNRQDGQPAHRTGQPSSQARNTSQTGRVNSPNGRNTSVQTNRQRTNQTERNFGSQTDRFASTTGFRDGTRRNRRTQNRQIVPIIGRRTVSQPETTTSPNRALEIGGESTTDGNQIPADNVVSQNDLCDNQLVPYQSETVCGEVDKKISQVIEDNLENQPGVSGSQPNKYQICAMISDATQSEQTANVSTQNLDQHNQEPCASTHISGSTADTFKSIATNSTYTNTTYSISMGHSKEDIDPTILSSISATQSDQASQAVVNIAQFLASKGIYIHRDSRSPSTSKHGMPIQESNISRSSKSSAKSADKSTNTSLLEKGSIISVVCRICYDETIEEPVISPCNCKGTIGLVHKSCLERWLAESNTDKCDLCHKQFQTERKTKYTVGKSLCVWLKYRSSQFAFPIRDLKGDIISCSVLAPVALGLIYICLLSADYYNQTEFAMVPAAQWTSLSVMMMGLIMLLGFFVWIYLVIRYHSRVWYFWWQRETIVQVYLYPDNDEIK